VLDSTGEPGGVGRAGQQLQPVGPGQGLGLQHLVPQLQGALVVALGLGEGVSTVGGQPGLDSGRQGSGGLTGRVPVGG
jgi:hypothetical protein